METTVTITVDLKSGIKHWQVTAGNKKAFTQSTAEGVQLAAMFIFNYDANAAIFEILKMANGRIQFSVKDRCHKNIYSITEIEKTT